MIRLLVLSLAALLLGSSAPSALAPAAYSRDPCVFWSVYDVAELVTGAPAKILRDIASYESWERDDSTGDDGLSEGRFQWYRPYLDYHRALFGYFNPRDPQLGTIRAGQLYMRNLAILGEPGLAIAGHNQGPNGVKLNGPRWSYVERVLGVTDSSFDNYPEAFRGPAQLEYLRSGGI